MKEIMNIKSKLLILLMIIAVIPMTVYGGNDKGKGKGNSSPSLKAGDAYIMQINNITMPMNRTGVMANVLVNGVELGRLDGDAFLFSGGFFMSGITNGGMWANAVASASRIEDYAPGTYATGRNDSRAQLYVLKATDGDFSDSWNEWKDAVALGAYFHDGDGDGVYNPVDLNGNGKWDATEDRPDLIGDETVWCVYHDAIDPALRRYNDVSPQGIEIRQTVFGFNSKGVVGNMLFLRYSLLNTGSVADKIDSVYFGVWADPDIGDANDDLVGCDTTLNAGYVYNEGDDPNFPGKVPPAFLMDFFQGPVSYIPGETFTDVNGNGVWDDGIDIAIDTAHNVQGQVRGIKMYPGARNLGLSSFVHYIQSHATHGDPNTRFEARSYMLGFNKEFQPLDPCTWAFGTVLGGVNCAQVDPRYSYSGDPVTSVGWINNSPVDQRQMSNTGPFTLEKGKPVDVVIAYVAGRGNSPLNSITVAKQSDITAQVIFDANFPSPPPPSPIVPTFTTGDGFIDIDFATTDQVKYRAVDSVLDIDRRFQGFYVTAFRSNSKADEIVGVINSKEVTSFEMADSIDAIWQRLGNGAIVKVREFSVPENQLDSAVYADTKTGRIRVRITKDPFTDGPLVKGKEYYFVLGTYTLNHNVIVNKATNTYGPKGDYLDISGGGYDEYETKVFPVVYGENIYAPANPGGIAEQSGPANGGVKYVVVDNNKLTGDPYQVEFKLDKVSNTAYRPMWSLKNLKTNQMLVTDSKNFNYDTSNVAGEITEGFILKVQPIAPAFGTATYAPAANRFYDNFSSVSGTGVYYVGRDIAQGSAITMPKNSSARSTIISADRLRKVELRFGAPNAGKAYRYLNGFIGSPLTRPRSYRYAAGVLSHNVSAQAGDWGMKGQGFVDVPFTAWVVDSAMGEQYQLAVGFIEMSATMPGQTAGSVLKGNPDGMWDPGDSLALSGEVIVIFDAPYDANGAQIQYTGGGFGTDTVWADPVAGWTAPASATTMTDTLKAIAKSPWFNALYVVGLQKATPTSTWNPGDVMTIPVATYPYTSKDKFTFTTLKGGQLSTDQKKALFEKVNVFPNPLFAYNPQTSYNNGNADQPFVTFTNLPADVTIQIYSLSGTLVRSLGVQDKSSPTSPFLRWDLENEEQLRVASGMYIALVKSPEYGEKILKFAVIMPQKQIQIY